jgi:hypothetical protein
VPITAREIAPAVAGCRATADVFTLVLEVVSLVVRAVVKVVAQTLAWALAGVFAGEPAWIRQLRLS